MGTELDETRGQRYAREEREEKEWEKSKMQRMEKAISNMNYCKCGGEPIIEKYGDFVYVALCPACMTIACVGDTPEEAAENWNNGMGMGI